MELSKNDSKMLQGLSVLAMLCLHLLDKSYEGLFTPLIFIFGKPLSFYLAQMSDFCVMGFAFCSGYAHMKLSDDSSFYRKRLKSLLILLCNFWLIILVFSIVSVISGHSDFMPGSLSKLLLNIFMLSNSYNGAWWYMYAYTILVLISPLMMKIIKETNPILLIGIGGVIYVLCHFLRFRVNTGNLFLDKIGPFGVTWFEYVIGALCFKYRYFTVVGTFLNKLNPWFKRGIFGIMFIAILIGHTLIVPSLIVAPFTGLIIITMFQLSKKPLFLEKIFFLIGKHSTNIWLTHMFFYSVLYVDLVYCARYPAFIFLLMLAITIPISMVLSTIQKPIAKIVSSI
ncbi:MAG: acyltransferase [Ruminococcus sp.]|nr:acyltransferase [Ruminococcus sp.]